jgi:hypothetical protein
MLNKRMALISVAVCLAAVMFIGLLSQAIAAPQAENNNAQQRGPRRGQRFDREEMQRMMAERLKETLGISDDERSAWRLRARRSTRRSRRRDSGAAARFDSRRKKYAGASDGFGQQRRKAGGNQGEIDRIARCPREGQAGTGQGTKGTP